MPNFNEQTWLEGFVNEAAAMGLDEQAAQELLKTAVRRDMLDTNPAFVAGFQAELEKAAMDKTAVNWKVLLGLLGGGVTALGGQELFNRMRVHWNRSPEQQQLANLMRESWMQGNPEDVAANMNFMVGQQMANRASRRGGMYVDPSYNPLQWEQLRQRSAYPGFMLGY